MPRMANIVPMSDTAMPRFPMCWSQRAAAELMRNPPPAYTSPLSWVLFHLPERECSHAEPRSQAPPVPTTADATVSRSKSIVRPEEEACEDGKYGVTGPGAPVRRCV